MLIELAITDFAIISSSRLTFGPGVHVLTGETGAGKSILLDALGAVLGDRASSDAVRTGAKRARIEALFDINGEAPDELQARLLAHGIENDGDQVVLTREIQSNGRSIARINGQIVTVSLLNEIGELLVDIHGQSDHFAIRRKDEQRKVLDRYARNEPLVAEVQSGAGEVLALRHRLVSLASGERERQQRRDLLSYQVEEIDNAALTVGEDDQVRAEQSLLGNAELLREETAAALTSLVGNDDFEPDSSDVSSSLQRVEQSMHRMLEIDPSVATFAERASEVSILAQDLAHDLRAYADGIEVNDERLGAVEDRLELIRTLKRKYGATVADVLEFGETARAELDASSGEEFDADALAQRLRTAEDAFSTSVVALSRRRKEAAAQLAEAVEESIASLRMGNAQVTINVSQTDDSHGIDVDLDGEKRSVSFDRTGIDEIEILVAPNRGESLKPLGRIASGGETARLMLAFKSILSEHDSIPTLVFDEIDVGVGGRTASVVGERLRDLASNHQVIVITHLPQIAAMADRHSRIVKGEQDDRVVSVVDEVQGQDVEREIAAMLDGEPVSAASIDTAREMIARSQRYRAVSKAT